MALEQPRDVLAEALRLSEGPLAEAQIVTSADPPFPITHVNRAWVNLCGFTPEEAIGRTCRILQGPETNFEAVGALHAAVDACAAITVRLLNYTKRAVPFLNDL